MSRLRRGPIGRAALLLSASVVAAALAILPGCGRHQPLTTASPPTKRELRVWQTETDRDAVKSLRRMIEDFERAHPGVKVQLESVAWSSLATKLAGAIQTGSEPDLAHLEPYMVASYVSRNMLLPIDDVIESIEKENDDRIHESVRDLQLFNGRRYGIAYAIGTSGFTYRKDRAARLASKEPRTWKEYVTFAADISKKSEGKLKVLLPGGDPLFIDLFFAELVANNNGKLFEPATNRPTLDAPEVVEVLKFLKDLSPHVAADWQTQPYVDQFNRLARQEAGSVTVTYARAAKVIEAVLKSRPSSPTPLTPDDFVVMPPPRGPRSDDTKLPVATIDCEPFVIFKKAKDRPKDRPAGQHDTNADLAKAFLRMFYQRDRYSEFVKAVPIHLTPVFEGMAAEHLNVGEDSPLRPWAEQTAAYLREPERVRPILLPDNSAAGRALPFLLEFQASKILNQAVTDVMTNGVEPDQAAKKAQKSAERLIEDLGFKRW